MSDYIEVDWEVLYNSASTTIEKLDLSRCSTKGDMLNRILEIMHEDAIQYVESVLLNSWEVDKFIDGVMKERESASE